MEKLRKIPEIEYIPAAIKEKEYASVTTPEIQSALMTFTKIDTGRNSMA